MQLFKGAAPDRIAASGACSYGVFWVLSLGAAILDRKGFRPNQMYYVAAGCAVIYVVIAALAFSRIKKSKLLLQVATIVSTLLLLGAFALVFPKEGLLGRGLLVSFAQLQVAYAIGICVLLEHRCSAVLAQTDVGE